MDCRLLCPWGFSRQEYWSELPCPPPGDLPDPGIWSALQADSFTTEPPGKPHLWWMSTASRLNSFHWKIKQTNGTNAVLKNGYHPFFFFFKFYFIFKLYIIVLVLPNIKMNPPQVYMCSPSPFQTAAVPHDKHSQGRKRIVDGLKSRLWAGT